MMSTLSPVDERLGHGYPREAQVRGWVRAQVRGHEAFEFPPPGKTPRLSSSESEASPRQIFCEGDVVSHLESGRRGKVTGVYTHASMANKAWVEWDDGTEKQGLVECRQLVHLDDVDGTECGDGPTPRDEPTPRSSHEFPLSARSGNTHSEHSSPSPSGCREPLQIGDHIEVRDSKTSKWKKAFYRGEDSLGRPPYMDIEYEDRRGRIKHARRDRIRRAESPRNNRRRKSNSPSFRHQPCAGACISAMRRELTTTTSSRRRDGAPNFGNDI